MCKTDKNVSISQFGCAKILCVKASGITRSFFITDMKGGGSHDLGNRLFAATDYGVRTLY